MAAAKAKRRKRRQREVSLSALPWDTGPKEQHKRAYRVTERGERDRQTGKMRNPNDIKGVKYLTAIEDLAAQKILTRHHVAAAEAWEMLCRQVFGSPARRSCLNDEPVGYGHHGPHPAALRDYRALCKKVGAFRARLLDDACWRNPNDPIPPTRHELLKAGLDMVDAFFNGTRR